MLGNKIELLAPAGSLESFEFATLYGADAVYLSLKQLGLRANAENFDPDQLKSAVKSANLKNIRVYVTCNVLPRNSQIEGLKDYFEIIRETGVNALIISDVGVLKAAKKYLPEVEVHISTQTGVVNYLAAQEFYNMGAKRVILARELSIEEIKEIREKTDSKLELETFVHGAMCMSFSGRCLISSYLASRDANRGECSQPCRYKYHLVRENEKGEMFDITEGQNGSYILNAKDLSMIEYLDKLAKAGVSSFKIEGRGKSFYYVAVITNAYRQALDIYYRDPDRYQLPQWLIDETFKVSHRPYSTGFYFGAPNQGQFYESGGYIRSAQVMATIEGSDERFIYCVQRNKIKIGDELEIIYPKNRPETIKIEEIFDENGLKIQDTPNSMMRFRLNNRLKKSYLTRGIVRKVQSF